MHLGKKLLQSNLAFFGQLFGARTKADATKCGHDLESSPYALQNGI
jgi:hypothetical protein